MKAVACVGDGSGGGNPGQWSSRSSQHRQASCDRREACGAGGRAYTVSGRRTGHRLRHEQRVFEVETHPNEAPKTVALILSS